jgi:stress responsive alpha/beta barrel protein
MMLWHVVLMKPRPDLGSSDRAAFVRMFKRAVREIPTVRDVRVGKRVVHGAGYEPGMPDAADYIAIIGFEDVAGLQTYLRHPAHADLGARFGQSFSSAWVYDFEMSEAGLAPLDAGGFI